MKFFTTSSATLLLSWLMACSSKSTQEVVISTDSAAISMGGATFNQDCSSCHNFESVGIGPSLAGITASAQPAWIMKFIANPKAMIDSHDERATKLFEKFNTVMPSFAHYPDEKINGVLAFLKTKEKVVGATEVLDPNALKDPIPEPIPMSNLVGELKLISEIPFSSEEDPKTRIVKLDHQPKTDKLFILDLRGKLYYLNNGKPEVYFDIGQQRKSFINKPGLATGFGSFAFHPEFGKNGLLYTTHSEPPKTKRADFNYNDSIPVVLQWVVTEWKTTNPSANTFSGEGRELFRIDMVSGIHGMQEASFNPYAKPGSKDYGLLYIGIGDGGAVENKFPFLVHNHQKIWGTIIRIDPAQRNSLNGQYGIPKSNPFVDEHAAAGEIFAIGFRNPHRVTWLKDGRMMASNIGHGNIESYSIIESGHDYGWPIREGTFVHLERGNMNAVYPLPADDTASGISYPVIQYDHNEGKAMSAGYEYTGSNVAGLKNKFFFADIVNGRVFYVDVKDLVQGNQAAIKEWKVSLDGKVTTMEALSGKARVDVRYGKDDKGELYVFTKPDGKLYKIVGTKGE